MSKPNIQAGIEHTVAQLLPHALFRDPQLPAAPLRWYERQVYGVVPPLDVGLEIYLDNSDTLDLTRTLPASSQADNRLWGCDLTQTMPPDADRADRSVVSVVVSTQGEVTVSHARYRKAHSKRATLVGVEHNDELPPQRRTELLDLVGQALTQATIEAPAAQQEFLQGQPVNPKYFSFLVLGCAASKEALRPLFAPALG